jgi:hypothetical protein
MSLLQRVEAARQSTATPQQRAPGAPVASGGAGRPWVAVPVEGGQPRACQPARGLEIRRRLR